MEDKNINAKVEELNDEEMDKAAGGFVAAGPASKTVNTFGAKKIVMSSNNAFGANNTAMGAGNSAQGAGNTAMGAGNTAFGAGNTAFGAGNTAFGAGNTAFGDKNNQQNS